MNKILFVINPVAGKGKGNQIISKIATYFDKSKYDIIISTKKGGIENIVKTKVNKDNYRSVVAVGGDGTLMETINGLMSYNGSIGVIPIGSGNDFAKTLGISENIDEALKIIDEGFTKEIYHGEINGQRFLNVIGVGIDANIIHYKESSKYLKGKLNYLVSTIKGIFAYKASDLKVVIDQKEYEMKPLFIAIGNGKYVGNGMKITPHADLTKETFEICVVGDLNKRTLLMNITNLYKGLHGKVDGVEFIKGREVIIEFGKKTAVNVDGNLINCEKIIVNKSNKKIKFLVEG